MDTTGRFDDAREATGGETYPPLAIGTDERRMHVRAYNHWVSLLHGRAYPSIGNLDPSGIADFGQHSVLLDFSRGIEEPTIQFLGKALREECAINPAITRIADVPSRSLLSRLTDHYLQIIANRAPIGFEAEFIGTRGHPMLYRGILMPFSSDEDSIDYIYGVINWKEMVNADTQARLVAELHASLAVAAPTKAPSPIVPATPVWADGPTATIAREPNTPGDHADAPLDDAVHVPRDDAVDVPRHDAVDRGGAALADRLMIARESAAAARAADTRTRAALYRALGRAHDFALLALAEPDGYARLLADAGIVAQARAPMTALVKLIFGPDYDKTRVTEFACVLASAADAGVAAGALAAFVEAHEGGIKGVVKAARAARVEPRPTPRPVQAPRHFARRPTLASFTLAPAPGTMSGAAPGTAQGMAPGMTAPVAAGAPMLLLARAGADGSIEVLASVDDAGLIRRALATIG